MMPLAPLKKLLENQFDTCEDKQERHLGLLSALMTNVGPAYGLDHIWTSV